MSGRYDYWLLKPYKLKGLIMGILGYSKVCVCVTLACCATFLSGCRIVEHDITAGTLAVEADNENKGGGDDVMIGALYFTSNFGAPSSSDTRYLPVRKLADNIGDGQTISSDRTQAFSFDWTDFQTTGADEEKSYSQTSAEFSSYRYGFSFEGAIFIAVEEDNTGDKRIRLLAEGMHERLNDALVRFIENEAYQGLVDDELGRRAYVEDKLRCFQDFVLYDLDCEVPGDTGVYHTRLSNVGHDLIGFAQLYFVGTENRTMINQIRQLFPTQRWFGSGQVATVPSNCGGASAADLHVCEFIDDRDRAVTNDINLLFSGKDALWILNLQNSTAIIE